MLTPHLPRHGDEHELHQRHLCCRPCFWWNPVVLPRSAQVRWAATRGQQLPYALSKSVVSQSLLLLQALLLAQLVIIILEVYSPPSHLYMLTRPEKLSRLTTGYASLCNTSTRRIRMSRMPETLIRLPPRAADPTASSPTDRGMPRRWESFITSRERTAVARTYLHSGGVATTGN